MKPFKLVKNISLKILFIVFISFNKCTYKKSNSIQKVNNTTIEKIEKEKNVEEEEYLLKLNYNKNSQEIIDYIFVEIQNSIQANELLFQQEKKKINNIYHEVYSIFKKKLNKQKQMGEYIPSKNIAILYTIHIYKMKAIYSLKKDINRNLYYKIKIYLKNRKKYNQNLLNVNFEVDDFIKIFDNTL